jgi:hypothetical protein
VSEERDRYGADRRALLEDVVGYRTKDSLSAAGVERLALTARELQRYNRELTETINDLGVKLRRLESVSSAVSLTEVNVNTHVRDTVIVVDSVYLPARAFTWRDNWMSIAGTMTDTGIDCRIRSRDTLVQAVHRVPHRFLFFRWGTKAIRQEIVSRNPHTEMVYTEYVDIINR